MIIGVDLGKKTTGIASSEGIFASPYKTIKHKSQDEAVEKTSKVINELNAQIIIVGFVEGKIKKYFEKFSQKLKNKNPQIEIILWDETLTSRQAQQFMIKQEVPKSKRAKKEHETAAAITLQSYLDSKDKT